MTDERKNEIWAMLPEDFKNLVKDTYKQCYSFTYFRDNSAERAKYFEYIGSLNMLEFLFGKHNLTAQAEEKPKEPRFNVGDLVVNNHKNRERGQIVAYFPNEKLCYSVRFGNEYHNMADSQLEPDSTIQVGNNNTPNVTKEVDYAQYRLDLAKEIAVAMIGKWSNADFIPHDSVQMANEIVKRLKETDNENNRTD